MIILAVLIIILVVFLQVILSYTGYGLIKEFPDSNQKFFDEGSYHVTDRKLTNMIRDKIITPDDELWYSFEVHNLKNFTTNINYELEFFKGGAREGEPYTGSDQLHPYASDPQNIKKIYLKTSGPYDVKLNVLFYNATNEKYAQYATGFEHIEVTSRSDQLQIAQNDYLLWGVIASSVIGGGTILALGFSVYYSRKETKLLETQNSEIIQENKARIRPILSRKELRKKIRNSNEQYVGELHTLTRQKALFHFQNTGILPAVNISRNYYAEIRETPSNEIKLNPETYVDVFKMASLAPNEYYSTDIFWRDPCLDESVDGKKCYFGLIIWYHDTKGIRYYYHIEGYFDHGEMMLNHVDMN